MIDRLIAGAGAVAHLANRLVAMFERDGRRGPASRHGALIVAGLALVGAVAFGAVGLEATDNATARLISPAEVAVSGDLGRRTYATISGGLAAYYVETFTDDDADGIQDPGETGIEWYYWLVDEATRTGVTVRSSRPPSELFIETVRGTILTEPEYVADRLATIVEGDVDIDVDRTRLIDATLPGTGEPTVVSPGGTYPADGTIVSVAGPSTGYVEGCEIDLDDDGSCDDDEVDSYQYAIYDPATRRGILIYTATLPEFAARTLTGMLRSDPTAVTSAQQTPDLPWDEIGITVSTTYILDEGATPRSASLAFGLAAALVALAGTVLIGRAGGYVVYRRRPGPLPVGHRAVAPGGRIAVRVTGLLRTPTGLLRVRETPAHVVRFQLSRPPATVEVAAPAIVVAPVDEAPSGERSGSERETTLIVERVGRPEGVAVGRAELTRLSVGHVVRFRGTRPGLRLTAGTGTIILSFDSDADRDRAAAELIAEAGLLARDTGVAHV